ncbi:unnamed protein product [Parascedosporium putredinis]|uniref:WSC domain-containing protein n=1 Tax=Parascedosporium putredinis TaxID=1442378 RepID=A0A9P1H817_9PEZI|nr:unnamed protein product [Parascedosporium putredinis]CAI7998894.1 unnamed protein product [Parascedosporium putredinis]
MATFSSAISKNFLILQLWALCCLCATPASFCASLNTASTNANLSNFQSHGLCGDFCRGDYAYAVVNYQSCWCSDYTPGDSTIVDDDRCNTGCPGYSELCGGKGVYGYLELGKNPKGTKGGDSDGSTVVSTVTAPDGVRTVTVTPSQNPGTHGAIQDDGQKKKGPSSGAIAGIVVGVVLAIAAIIAGACLILRRRRQARNGQEGAFEARSSHSSAFAGWGSDAKEKDNPAAPAAAVVAGSVAGSSSRNSRLMPIDPRMDPFSAGIYARTKSRESINTLHDDQDYSRRVHQPRVLRATNPDPLDE